MGRVECLIIIVELVVLIIAQTGQMYLYTRIKK